MKIVMQARPVEKAPRRSQPKMLGRQRRKGLSSKRRRKKERKVQVRDVCLCCNFVLRFVIPVDFLFRKKKVYDQPIRPILIGTNVHKNFNDTKIEFNYFFNNVKMSQIVECGNFKINQPLKHFQSQVVYLLKPLSGLSG